MKNNDHLFQSLPEAIYSAPAVLRKLSMAGIIKLPTRVYQMMADCINTQDELENNQARIRHLLTNYIREEYPNHYLESFQEFTIAEARKISPYLEWGFYIKLIPKNNQSHNPVPIEDTIKQLTFG